MMDTIRCAMIVVFLSLVAWGAVWGAVAYVLSLAHS